MRPRPVADDNAALYCRNIANAAADARYARQVDAIAEMAKELDQRIASLEAKRAEYEDWVKRREEFLSRADAAWSRSIRRCGRTRRPSNSPSMDQEAAAAILAQLNPRTASAILNEMDADDGGATHQRHGGPAGQTAVAGNNEPSHLDLAARRVAGGMRDDQTATTGSPALTLVGDGIAPSVRRCRSP